MPTVYLTTLMRRHTDGRATLDVQGGTVSDALASLEARFPAVSAHLKDSDGQLLRHVNIFVNGADIRDLNGVGTQVAPTDEIQVIPAMAGG